MTDDPRTVHLQAMRKSVKAHKKGAENMQRRSDAIRMVFEEINRTNVMYDKSVGCIVKEAGVSVTLLTFFRQSAQRGGLFQNMFFLCRMVMEECSEFYENDDDVHICDQECKHQDEFYYFILSNFKATPKIKKLVQEWKELGPRVCNNSVQNDRFREIFDSLEDELAKDKFKISTSFIDLIL